MKPTLAMLNSLSVLLAACATTRRPLSAELPSELRAKAQECMRASPAIRRHEGNRSGAETA